MMTQNQPILYYAAVSSPCRAVLLTAAEIGVELNLKPINISKGEQLTPEFIKINPQHTIPLLDDNGIIIFDSQVICGYLCDKYGKNDRLYPKDLVNRSAINARLHFNSGFIFSRMRFLFEPILYQNSSIIPSEKIEYIQKCWPILEEFLSDSLFVCGNEMTIADLCFIASVTSGRNYAPIDADKYPKLIEWINRMCKLPYYERVNGRAVEQSRNNFLNKLKENQLKN